MSDQEKTLILSAEPNKQFFRRLNKMLSAFNARKVDEAWGVAGSQALSTWKYHVRGSTVVLEDETYFGVSLTGPVRLVDEMAEYLKRLGETK